MKKLCVLLFSTVLCNFTHAQVQHKVAFSLSDSTFTEGSVFTAYINIELDNRNFRPESKPLVDSIADFMLRHPELIIEIGSHTDQRGGDSSNLDLSQRRATFVKNYFVNKGVDQYSIPAVGYGESSPVHPQSAIDKAKSQEEKEDLYQANRRYEFRILYVPDRVTFSLTDSTFTPGAILQLDIKYDGSKPVVRPESFALVDSLARFLIAHPGLIIEIGNHVDTRGTSAANVKITQMRSQDVVNRLVHYGVPAAQVVAKGYGESEPLVTEAYIAARKSRTGRDELHLVNIRTEIKILSVQ